MLKKIGQIIKNNWIYILVLVVGIIVMNIRLPYVIYAPGGIENIDDKYVVEGINNEKTGSLNLVYVTEYQAYLPIYLLALIKSDWEIVPLEDVKYASSETVDEIEFRSDFYLKQANSAALYNAYYYANKEIDIIAKNFYVLYVDDIAQTTLKIGDELMSINGVKITSTATIKEVVDTLKENDEVKILVKNKKQEYERTAKVKMVKGVKYLGISIGTLEDYKVNPSVTFKFAKEETGPSAGLVTSLALYNTLTNTDITRGRKVVVTGTIDKEGNVGSIGSIKHKLGAAVKNKADIFIVPSGENYEEVMKEMSAKNYNIKIIPVASMKEAIEKLK